MTLEELKIIISAETAGIKEDIKQVQNEMERLGDRSTKTGEKLDSLFQVAKIGVFIAGVKMAASAVNSLLEGYFNQIQQETKLATIMEQRMNATESQINKVKELTEALELQGVVEADVLLAGAQQAATFLRQTDSVNTLIPAMADLLAQQKGVNATSQDAVNIGNMIGKVLQGQIGALTRVGITFDETQEKILQFGTEEEKVAALAQIITDNVGHMNQALTETPEGQLKQIRQEMDRMKDTIAEALTPSVVELMQTVGKLVTSLAPLVTVLVDSIMPVINAIAGIVQWIVNLMQPLIDNFNILKPIIMGLAAAFIAYKTAMIGAAIATWAKTTAEIASKSVATWGAFLPVGIGITAGAIAATAGIISEVQGYAKGGHPDKYDLFYAGEAGPELVTSVGGQSTVLNENQISRIFEQASYKGALRAGNNKGISNPSFKFYLDGTELNVRLEKSNKINGNNLVLSNQKFNGGY